jgi:hypothetical protein
MVSALAFTCAVQAAEGQHIAHAVLQARSGATVASQSLDSNGCARFSNVPPGDYRIVLTSAHGRSVTVADFDQRDCLTLEGPPAPDGFAGSPPASGKASVSSFSVMKPAARDTGSGLATGRRMHKPYCFLMDWDGAVKGGFASETAAQAEGQRLPDCKDGRCAVKVVVDDQRGTIELSSWSMAAANHKYVGTVTLVK